MGPELTAECPASTQQVLSCSCPDSLGTHYLPSSARQSPREGMRTVTGMAKLEKRILKKRGECKTIFIRNKTKSTYVFP